MHSYLMFRENDLDNVTFLWLKMKLDIGNWLKIIEPVALFPYQKHLWFIKSSWEIFIVNILEVSGETQRCNFTSRYGNYYLNDFGFFLILWYIPVQGNLKKSEVQKHSRFSTKLTLTRSIGLPPHTPVAQKIADQRWLIANSAKRYFFLYKMMWLKAG